MADVDGPRKWYDVVPGGVPLSRRSHRGGPHCHCHCHRRRVAPPPLANGPAPPLAGPCPSHRLPCPAPAQLTFRHHLTIIAVSLLRPPSPALLKCFSGSFSHIVPYIQNCHSCTTLNVKRSTPKNKKKNNTRNRCDIIFFFYLNWPIFRFCAFPSTHPQNRHPRGGSAATKPI